MSFKKKYFIGVKLGNVILLICVHLYGQATKCLLFSEKRKTTRYDNFRLLKCWLHIISWLHKFSSPLTCPVWSVAISSSCYPHVGICNLFMSKGRACVDLPRLRLSYTCCPRFYTSLTRRPGCDFLGPFFPSSSAGSHVRDVYVICWAGLSRITSNRFPYMAIRSLTLVPSVRFTYMDFCSNFSVFEIVHQVFFTCF